MSEKAVLNLIITGIPSIQWLIGMRQKLILMVLNLIITGIPSILEDIGLIAVQQLLSFKPYYNWNTFNTRINASFDNPLDLCFKPYYNWNTFNT